jgi:prevent-host-death family protein
MVSSRRLSASEAGRVFAEVVNQVALGRTRVVIGRRGKELAAVVPMSDLRTLERLEDRRDAADVRRVESDPNDRLVPWDRVKRELGRALSDRGQAKRATRPRPAPKAGTINRHRGRRRAR